MRRKLGIWWFVTVASAVAILVSSGGCEEGSTAEIVDATPDNTTPDVGPDGADAADVRDVTSERGEEPLVEEPSPNADHETEPAPNLCFPTQTLLLDTLNAASTASGAVDFFSFRLDQTERFVARVRPTGGGTPALSVRQSCATTGMVDGGVLLAGTAVAGAGSYVAGSLPGGQYDLRIDWGSIAAGTSYTFDVMASGPAANASCSVPRALSLDAGVVQDNTFQATDTTTGCTPASVYGRLFYGISVPATAAWRVTATPGSNWQLELEAFSGCASSTSCSNGRVVSQPGQPVSLVIDNAAAATLAVTLSVGASAGDALSGGGDFSVTAQALAACDKNAPATSCAGCCNANGVCLTGEATCGTTCADLQTDASNCGACGHVCSATPPDASAPVAAAHPVCAAGSCSIVCDDSTKNVCSGSCTNIASDAANCGACGHACTSGQQCQGGACLCSGSTTLCAGGCTDLTTDSSNCGACGHACAGSETCQTGVCSCAAGTALCGGTTCVDITASPSHCGASCATCAGGTTCQAGSCGCPTGMTLCSGTCVDLQSTVNHCGSCSTNCVDPVHHANQTSTCSAGSCTYPSCQPGTCGSPATACATPSSPALCGPTCGCCPTWLDPNFNCMSVNGQPTCCDTTIDPTCADPNSLGTIMTPATCRQQGVQ